jgi:hypothetical protein
LLSIELDRSKTLLRVQFGGCVTTDDLANLARMLTPIADRVEKVLIDLSNVSESALSLHDVIQRASAGPRLRGRKRVFLAASALTFAISRQFETYREGSGHEATPIVKTMEEACSLLGVEGPPF